MVVNAPVHMTNSLKSSLKIYLSMVLNNILERKAFCEKTNLVSFGG